MEIFGLSYMESLWLILMVLMLAVEVGTVGLTCIWFAGGALVALIAAAFGAPIPLQVILFFGVSILLLIFTRPWAVKYLNSRKMRTNYEATIGKHVIVLERVDNVHETGKARLEGMEWTARAVRGDMTFEPDEEAVVVNVVGVKLILDKLPGPEMQPIDGKSVVASDESVSTTPADTAEEHL
ncbi:MAG: NfeD family protein [Lachnospiraceae bacterium]|nr:NfeD family protein [Lachnospiraceae bacterium]